MNDKPNYNSPKPRELERSYKLEDIIKQRRFTISKLGLQSGEKVFDVGCGVGFLVYDIAQIVGKSGKVIGFDQSPEMIIHAQKRCKDLLQTKFCEGEATNFPQGDQIFDTVSCTQVLL